MEILAPLPHPIALEFITTITSTSTAPAIRGARRRPDHDRRPILAACDAFDAMTSKRAFREAYDRKQTIVFLEDEIGRLLDRPSSTPSSEWCRAGSAHLHRRRARLTTQAACARLGRVPRECSSVCTSCGPSNGLASTGQRHRASRAPRPRSWRRPNHDGARDQARKLVGNLPTSQPPLPSAMSRSVTRIPAWFPCAVAPAPHDRSKTPPRRSRTLELMAHRPAHDLVVLHHQHERTFARAQPIGRVGLRIVGARGIGRHRRTDRRVKPRLSISLGHGPRRLNENLAAWGSHGASLSGDGGASGRG